MTLAANTQSKTALLGLILALAGCDGLGDHDHEDEHGHGHSHGAKEEPDDHDDEAEPLALTLWSKTHELFVEFDAPRAGKESKYHAHVSRIADNKPATSGAFSVRFLQSGKPAAELTAGKVARQGIFIPRGNSPAAPGTYRLVFTYKDKDASARWDAGQLKISDKPATMADQAEGAITFLKEQQWKIPFATQLPSKGKLARELALPATVEADPALSRVLTAPSAGAVFWSGESGPSVTGMVVKRGQLLGRLMPAAAGEHVSALHLQIQRGLIERDHAKTSLARVASLAKEGLVPARQLVDAKAAMKRAEAGLVAARQKSAQLRGRGARPLPLISPADGTLVALHFSDGHQVAAGQVLVHVAAESRVLVRASAFSLDLPRLALIRQARLLLARQGQEIQLTKTNSRLLTRRVVIDPATLTAPVTYRVQGTAGDLRIGELAELRLAVGEEKEYLTVPRQAVVEINTRPFLFVMRSGESFARLGVRLGPSDGRRVAVLSGLKPGDRVVTVGAFDVYAASLTGTVESHRH